MTRLSVLGFAAVLVASVAADTGAQARMIVRPESKVTLAGSSNVHDWACHSSEFAATIDLDSGYATRPMSSIDDPIVGVRVAIPVRSLRCGNGRMDGNMYKALKADQFPTIAYTLGSYEIDRAATDQDRFVATTMGELTVAGATLPVAIPITAVRGEGGSMVGTGTVRMRMTDLGIKPPVALLGTLRTKNEIEVSFRVLLDKSVVVALTRASQSHVQ